MVANAASGSKSERGLKGSLVFSDETREITLLGSVTAEECRLRFARLHREEDASAEDSGNGVLIDDGDRCDVVGHDNTVSPNTPAPGVLQNAGLSFADLERKARNMKSRYIPRYALKDLPTHR